MDTNKTILIIDDLEDNIEILQHQLSNEGYEKIFTATDGHQGMQILKDEAIDLLLLDINMPELDGITLLGQIRQDDSLSDVAILMVTAVDDVKTALDCLKKGACGYITKPYTMTQINQQIENCFNK